MSHTAQASCVYDYVERDNVKMRVCGACGLRDPFDPCVKKINLNKVNAEHWLHLDTEAETRLRDLRPFTLAKVGADGCIEEVVVQRAMLHNMARVADNGGALHTYHVVPEALVVEDDEDEEKVPTDGSAPRDCIRLCQHCARGFRCDASRPAATCPIRSSPPARLGSL